MITISVESAPIFVADKDESGHITVNFFTMLAILEWYNSLSTPAHKAYYSTAVETFTFPSEGPWVSSGPKFEAPPWLTEVDACTNCLTYNPCDCEDK